MKRPRIVCGVLVASIASGVFPSIGRAQAPVETIGQTAAAETLAVAPPVIQVRGFWRSSVVSVVACDVEDAWFGLRTEISRNGTLVGGLRFGDHRLYLAPFQVWYFGGFAHATVVRGEPLLSTGWRSDPYSCFYGVHCSPMSTVGVRLPDALLRANRDSLVVNFLPRSRDPWSVTVRRALIAAYLATVDSVVASMKKTWTMQVESEGNLAVGPGAPTALIRARQ
jgi:hypothetical protein